MKLQATFYVLAAIFATTLAASVTDVANDIEAMTTKTQTLRTDISNFPDSGATTMDLMAIQNDIDDLDDTINHSTSDVDSVQPRPVTESDGQHLMDGINKLKPAVLDVLTQVVKKKAAFTGVGAPDVIVQDLKKLQSSTSEFGNSVKNIVPDDIKPQVTSEMDQVNNAFNDSIADYSS